MGTLISEMTEREFLNLVVKIYNDDYATEKEHTDAILKFVTVLFEVTKRPDPAIKEIHE